MEIQVLDFGKEVPVNPVSVEDLNDDMRVNQLETGEGWEGAYVELYNVTAQAPRISFQEAIGSASMFLMLRETSSTYQIASWYKRMPVSGGTFVPFQAGTVFDTLRGVIAHSANGAACAANGRGYELYPFQESDYVVQQGSSPPQIASITRKPDCSDQHAGCECFRNNYRS